MAKNKVSEWSTTAASNTDVGNIDIAEGCAPSGINNAIREVMAQIKDMQTGADGDNFAVGGNLSVTGTSAFTGAITASGGVTGNVTGDLTGNADTATTATSATSATSATKATNIAGGGAGQVPYNSGADTTAFLAAGTSGQFLQSNGTSAPSWGDVRTLTADTAKASTSGATIDFTGIPSWVKRITVMFSGVSTSGTSDLLIQAIVGSVVTTGYNSTSSGSSTVVLSTASSTAGFAIKITASTNVLSGIMSITNINSNNFVSNHSFKLSTDISVWGGGDVALGGGLTGIRITTVNGTDTFDAGTINIMYE